jgi:hypothetical protein
LEESKNTSLVFSAFTELTKPTNIERSPWEASRCSANQNTRSPSTTSEGSLSCSRSPKLVPILSQMNPLSRLQRPLPTCRKFKTSQNEKWEK